ncbi:MAG TPA: alpha-2-macroglobulin [bacterium]|nr:alpha-2-macroglobulin [bacterium]
MKKVLSLFGRSLSSLRSIRWKDPGTRKKLFLGGLLLLALGTLFHYRPGIRISQFSPTGQVAVNQQELTIQFNRKVAEESALNRRFQGHLMDIDPPIPGFYIWKDARTLSYTAAVPLAPATRYTVQVLEDAVSGKKIDGSSTFHFQTPDFEVKSVSGFYERTLSKGEKSRVRIGLEFNYPVAQKDLVQNVIVLDENGKTVPFSFETLATGSLHSLITQPIEPRKGKAHLKVALTGDLACVSCGGGLGHAVTQDLEPQMAKDLELKSAEVDTNPGNIAIRLNFSSPVDTSRLKDYIVVSPDVEFSATASYQTVFLRGRFQGGQTYHVTVRDGLQGIDGSVLPAEVKKDIEITDLEPMLTFADDGFYLPRRGEMNLAINSVNVSKAQVMVDKVFMNNLVYLLREFGGRILGASGYYRYYYYEGQFQNLGQHVKTEDVTLSRDRNTMVTTAYSMRELAQGKRKGLFRVFLRTGGRPHQADAGEGDDEEGGDDDYDYDTNRKLTDSKWVLVTDIGLIARKTADSYVVFANSLTTLHSLAGVELTLISTNNQPLAHATTDKDGKAVFEGLSAFDKEKMTPLLITAKLGDDESFLLFDSSEISLADYDISGRDQSKDLQAYLFTDRGVYRPGDKAHLAGILRTAQLDTPPSMPAKLTLYDPQSKVFLETMAKSQSDGGFDLDIPIPTYAKTGKYRASLTIGEKNEVGAVSFSVEDFIPDRIRVAVKTDKDSYQLGDSLQAHVQGDFLFGAPAANQKVSVRTVFTDKAFRPKGYSDFKFGDPNNDFKEFETEAGQGTLDAQGGFAVTLKLPDAKPRGLLSAQVVGTVLDEGSRAISGVKTVDFHPYPYYIGLRNRMKSDEYGDSEGRKVRYDIVSLDPQGKPFKAGPAKATLYRKVWESLYRKDNDGHYRFVSEYQFQIVKQVPLDLDGGIEPLGMDVNEYGQFKLEVSSADGQVITSDEFSAWGWGYSSVSMAQPDKLDLSLDKSEFSPGDIAQLRVRSPFPGKILVTVERDDVYWYTTATLTENTGVIQIPVPERFKPNVYVTATLIRSTDSMETHAPARAFGLVRMMVSKPADRIPVSLKAPAEIRPLTSLTVEVNAKPGAQVILAAVDSGILQLTDFRSPDPYDFFYGPLRLATVPMDLYSYVLPEVAKGKGPTGGSDGRRERNLARPQVKRVKPVALWSGLVKTNMLGHATVTFQVPQFDGELRLMAVAFKGSRFGAAESPLIVRSPIVLTPNLPRFLAMGDSFEIPVGVFNGTKQKGKVTVHLSSSGPVQVDGPASAEVEIGPSSMGQVLFQAHVLERVEPTDITLTADGLGASVSQVTSIPVRPARPIENFGGSGSVPPGKAVSFDLPDKLVQGTDRYSLVLSGLPTMRYMGGLAYLLHYPYGCIEQTTSAAFPLLYFNEVAKVAAPDLFKNNSADYFVGEGIRKIESMMDSRGGFSYWPGGSYSNYWCSVYASHFLAEAKLKGYDVSDRVIDGITHNLRSVARGDEQRDYYSYYDGWGENTRVYACYVLSLLGDPDMGTMNYFREQKLNQLPLYSRAQLALAYIHAGDPKTARSILPANARPNNDGKRETGGYFNSDVREAAMLLDAYVELDGEHPAIPSLLKFLNTHSRMGRWYNTQETSFALMALGKTFTKLSTGTFTGEIRIGGKKVRSFDSKSTVEVRGEDMGGQKVEIETQGEGTAFYFWEADGVVQGNGPVTSYDNDISVRRVYKDRDGGNLDLSKVAQGQMIVAEVTVSGAKDDYKNLAVVDLLPAGFEVENPRLESREVLPWVSQENGKTPVDFLDLRDDRVIFFLPLGTGQTYRYYYTLRAVTAGQFQLPPVKVESMYDPAVTSISDAGGVTVLRQ